MPIFVSVETQVKKWELIHVVLQYISIHVQQVPVLALQKYVAYGTQANKQII